MCYSLGIETSCDETAAAIVKNGYLVLSNIISSQADLHQYFGGVVPELAARKHIESISFVVKAAIQSANIDFSQIDVVGVTYGPGLAASLLVGLSYAKTLAFTLKKPIVGVNHLLAHIYSAVLDGEGIPYPAVALVVSGGHTNLVYLEDFNKYKLLGKTLDDAAGEAYDKVAKFLKLGYPGGPQIERLANIGDNCIPFQKARVKSKFDFSFSGLKTAVIYHLLKNPKEKIENLAASFQYTLISMLIEKTTAAIEEYRPQSVILCGGVAANSALRRAFEQIAKVYQLNLYLPKLCYCTDNAAMVAGLAHYQYKINKVNDLNLDIDANAEI